MRLTVHIGTTKTGTSSIQRFLHENRDPLKGNGILVPTTLGHIVHYYAAVASLPYGESSDLAKTVEISSPLDQEGFSQRVSQDFYDEVAAAECHQVVITCEQLQSRLLSSEYIWNFRKLFCSGFEEVCIVVYVRPQLDQAVSLYSTVLRTGYSGSLSKFIQTRMRPSLRPYFDLKDVISRWAHVFGYENVMVRPYKGLSSRSGAVGDFSNHIGIELSRGHWRIAEPRNSSIGSAGQELLRLLNRSGSLDVAVRKQVVAWAENNCGGSGELPTLALAREFQGMFDESNKWVTESYFPDNPEYLVPNWPSS